MDLATLNTKAKSEAGIEFELKHPATGDPLGMFVTVLGADSERFRARAEDFQRRNLKQARRGKADEIGAELQKERIALCAAMTADWRGLELGGAEVAFSEAKAAEIYGDEGWTWILDQVDRAINDRANFLPGSATP